MKHQNENVHVVYDSTHWAVAIEGEGRLHTGLDFTQSVAIATALAIEREALLYIHDKQGAINERVNYSSAPTSMPEGIYSPKLPPPQETNTVTSPQALAN